MNLKDYKIVFISIGLIGSLLIALPALSLAVQLPAATPFSEIFLLGANQQFADYPSTVASGQNYTVYLGVGNHEGFSNYYMVDVKLGNSTDPLPNATDAAVNALPILYEAQFACSDGQLKQKQIVFSIASTFSETQSTMLTITINGVSSNINKPTLWNNATQQYRYELFFELFSYDSPSDSMVFTKQFTALQLNATIQNVP
jgi:hypothetical protein